jgi:hypothetical protein
MNQTRFGEIKLSDSVRDSAPYPGKCEHAWVRGADADIPEVCSQCKANCLRDAATGRIIHYALLESVPPPREERRRPRRESVAA